MSIIANMAQTENGDGLYLLTVYGHSVIYADSVCFFTDYEKALRVQKDLQDKIDIYKKEEKEHWKDRCWVNPKYVSKEYGNPTAVVVKVSYDEFDKVRPEYADIIKNQINPRPLKEIPSSGPGCWFDSLKSAKKRYDEKVGALCDSLDGHNAYTKTKGTQTSPSSLYVVTDYHMDDDYMNSKIIGVFTDPELAQDAQSKVGASYGLDVVHGTWSEKNFVELIGFDCNESIDPKEINYYRMKIVI